MSGPAQTSQAALPLAEQAPSGAWVWALGSTMLKVLDIPARLQDEPDRVGQQDPRGHEHRHHRQVREQDGDPAGIFYDLEDVKPGDSGHVEFCFRIVDNPSYVWSLRLRNP